MFSSLPTETIPTGFFDTASGDYPELEDLSWLDNIIHDVGGNEGQAGTLTPLQMASFIQSAPNPSTGPNSESPSETRPDITSTKKTAVQNVPKRPKGRPKRIHDGPESAAQRRREQIRLAQQAYRNRKEETIASLREENTLLKSRISDAEQAFRRLLDVGSHKSLRPEDIEPLRILQQIAYKQKKTRSIEPKPKPNAQVEKHSSLSEMVDSNQDFLNQEASHDLSEYKSPNSLPLSIRLRYEGLKKGYELITSGETPNSVLLKCFKHYVFSCTRDEITTQINTLLYESSIIMNRNLTPPDSPEKDLDVQEGLLAQGHALKDLYFADTEGYVVPEGVEKYLIEKGLKVDPGSNLFTLPASKAEKKLGPLTLFDEIRGSQELHFSVTKLLQELVDRVICLNIGPGLRTHQIDEAIQATIMAAV